MPNSDYHFSAAEWSRLPYNFMDGIDGYKGPVVMLERFPDLKKLTTFNTKLLPGYDRDKVIAYIVLYYSLNTPLDKIDDPIERKKVAAQESGWKVEDNGRFCAADEDILFCRYKDVNAMILSYLRHFKNAKFTLLHTMIEAFYFKIKLVLDDENTGKKTDHEIEIVRGRLLEQAGELEKRIEATTNDYLNDESPYLREDLFSFIEAEPVQLMLSPERRAALKEMV